LFAGGDPVAAPERRNERVRLGWAPGSPRRRSFLDNLLATLDVAVLLGDETWELGLRVVPLGLVGSAN
jgi:hypothetical protein